MKLIEMMGFKERFARPSKTNFDFIFIGHFNLKVNALLIQHFASLATEKEFLLLR
jgi:hypothetical protein